MTGDMRTDMTVVTSSKMVTRIMVTVTTMFFGLLLNAYVISSLNQALATMNSKKELTGKQLDSIKSVLLVKGVPSDLRGRILECALHQGSHAVAPYHHITCHLHLYPLLTVACAPVQLCTACVCGRYYEYLLGSCAALDEMRMFDNLPSALSAQLNLSSNRRLAARCAFFSQVSILISAVSLSTLGTTLPSLTWTQRAKMRYCLPMRGAVAVVAGGAAAAAFEDDELEDMMASKRKGARRTGFLPRVGCWVVGVGVCPHAGGHGAGP